MRCHERKKASVDADAHGSRQRSASTLNRDMTPLRAAPKLALAVGHVTTDAAWKTKMRPLKDADRRRDVYLDLVQRRALIAKAPADLAMFMSALSLMPLRPGAMAARVAGNFNNRLLFTQYSLNYAHLLMRIESCYACHSNHSIQT